MADTRCKNEEWSLKPGESGNYSFDAAQLAVLMDLRDELHQLNALLQGHRFQRLPDDIRQIERRLAKKIRLNRA